MKRGALASGLVTDDSFIPVNGCARHAWMRTYDDVLMQLATLYFTGTLSYFHLLWIRGESVLDWRPFFFPFSPLTVVFQHVFAMLTIFFHYIKSKLKSEEHPFNIYLPLRVLFGRVPSTPTTESTDNSLSSQEKKTSSPPTSTQPNEFSTILGTAKTLGLILQFASLILQLSYCVFGIRLFIRRLSRNPDSLINADYIALQLSISGILLVLLSLPHTPLTPLRLFTDPVPPLPPTYRKTTLHHTILFCRDSASPTLYAPRYAPSLFTYLQQFRQIFYSEALSALLIFTDFGTVPPIPLRAVIANYDSFGAIPLPPLRDGYYFSEVGGRLVFAVFMLHAVRSALRGRRLWEKEALAAQQALLEPPTATGSGSSPSSSSSASVSAAERQDQGVVAVVWGWVKSFLADPLAYTPSVTTLFPYLMVAAGAMTVWNRVWPDMEEWEMWPADVPCPQQWRDPLVGKWEGWWEWWWLGQNLMRD
ncbi:hypothetical protein BFW01_g8654 [Lasiodiplodia theobromae]|nr:hypothetical protein BFW01_g8654 [Lasiodiplodia theobromae]